MPKMEGKEFLQIIKADPYFRDIPVVILSTSSHAADIEDTYAYQASAYLNKPLEAKAILSHYRKSAFVQTRQKAGLTQLEGYAILDTYLHA